MIYTQEEINILVDAFKVYTIMAANQLPPQAVEILSNKLAGILKKITSLQSGQTVTISAPTGITEEWFEKVCKTCKSFKDGNCIDNVTQKYPGKCDPILHYEVSKLKS